MKLPAAMAQSGSLSVARQARPIVRRWFVARPAFTLVEVLIATAITLLLMAGIVTLFASVSESVSRGQAMMETGDRLRGAQHRLQTDLKYITVPLLPSRDPRDGLGSFEIVEGPGPYLITGVGPGAVPSTRPVNSENGNTDDTTVGDVDDILMFTARSYGEPFVGRGGTSQVAEICWFMRGTTLYRRVLLVLPELVLPMSSSNTAQPMAAMYNSYDVSVHQEGGNSDPNANWGELRLVPNSLGDLTKRENRYAHWPRYAGGIQGYPHDVRMWGAMGLPTLQECSHANWPFPAYGLYGNTPPLPGPPYNRAVPEMDYWLPQPFAAPHAWGGMVDPETGADNNYLGPRVTEDVALTNVLSFDVKVWDPLAPVLRDGSNQILEPGDPGYRSALSVSLSAINTWVSNGRPSNSVPPAVVRLGAYVDLYYARGIASPTNTISSFSHAGDALSQLQATAANPAAIWDVFPTHYEHDGVDQDGDGLIDEGTDGLNNDPSVNRTRNKQTGAMVVENSLPTGADGGVDDDNERETAPPYDAPIRSIQIKIRVFERDSRQIREVTVTQDFVP